MSAHANAPTMRRILSTAAALAILSLSAPPARAASVALARATPNPALTQVAWQQRLGASVPLQLTFSDEQGRVVSLARYFRPRRPVALVLMYLSCSRLCPLTLSLTQQTLARAGLVPGRDFELLAVSIDPYDGVAAAARRKATLSSNAQWQSGLHLLTATPTDRPSLHPASERLADAAGFGFLPNAALAPPADATGAHQFVHPAGWVLIDPRGRISRYFFGLQYDPAAVRQAVHSAAAQQQPTWTQPLRLLCDCLTVLTGRYDGTVLNLLRLLCVTLLGLGGAWLWRRVRPMAAGGRA